MRNAYSFAFISGCAGRLVRLARIILTIKNSIIQLKSVTLAVAILFLFTMKVEADDFTTGHGALLKAEEVMRQGDLAQGIATLLAYSGENVQEETARLWLLSQARMLSQKPRAALPDLERLVTAFPDDPRFRLALGRALYEVGADDRARFHLERAKGAVEEEELLARIDELIDSIDRRKSWEISFRGAIRPESNPFRRTASDTVSIGGINFRLDPNATAEGGTSLVLESSAVWTPNLSRDVKANLGLSMSSQSFEDSSLNDISLRARAGVLAVWDRGRAAGAGLSFQRRTVGGDLYSDGPGAYATAQARIGPRTRGMLRYSVVDLEFPDLPNRNGLRRSVSIELQCVISPQMVARTSVFQDQTLAQASHESGIASGLSAGATYAWKGGLITSVSGSLSGERRNGESPLFAEKRSDQTAAVSFDIGHREFTVAGFAPTLTVGYDQRVSNISLYDFSNTRVSVGLTREF